MAGIKKHSRWILDILYWPYGVFVEAFVGVLYPPTSLRMAKRRKVATVSLVACLAAFAVAWGLSSIPSLPVTTAPLWGIGVVLMFVFLVAGKLCADEGEQGRDGNEESQPGRSQ